MEKKEWTIGSSYEEKPLHVVGWFPENPVGVVQISHGMCEYVERYTHLVDALTGAGYAVVGNDHLGHGKTAANKDELGYMAPQDGYLYMMKDLRKVTEWIQENCPGLPIVLYGHSMGSFIARMYASEYSDGISAYVFSGTGGPNPATGAGLIAIRALSRVKGDHFRSEAVTKMAFGAYLDHIKDAKTGYEWVTSDPEELEKYTNDPFCMYTFTLSGYYDLMSALDRVSHKYWPTHLVKELPYLLVSGVEDPVGAYGNGVKTVAERMEQAGCVDVTTWLIEGMRHEPHNEVHREAYFHQLLGWLKERVEKA